jgi:NTE family protein
LFSLLVRTWEGAGGGTAARHAIGRLALDASPGDEPAFVARTAAGLPEGWPAAVRVVATAVGVGEPVVLRSWTGVPLARAVAASCAVPLSCPPVTINGDLHLDGALGSGTNAATLLPDVKDGDVDHVVIVSPGGFGTAAHRLWTDALATEVALLRAAGAGVTVVTPGASGEAAMGPDPMSDAGALLAMTAGRQTGRHTPLG